MHSLTPITSLSHGHCTYEQAYDIDINLWWTGDNHFGGRIIRAHLIDDPGTGTLCRDVVVPCFVCQEPSRFLDV